MTLEEFRSLSYTEHMLIEVWDDHPDGDGDEPIFVIGGGLKLKFYLQKEWRFAAVRAFYVKDAHTLQVVIRHE